MAGTKYGSFAVGDANIDNVMLQLAGVETGYCALTLTEMTTTNVPQIAAGSKIEVGGSLFKFDANETITGTATTGTNYIQLVPSGSSITAAWTTTAPTWSDSKQGWYDSTGAYRYAPIAVMYTSPYYKKWAFDPSNRGPAGVLFSATFYGTIASTTTEATFTSIITYETGATAAPYKFSDAPWGMLTGASSGYITIPFTGLYWLSLSAPINSGTATTRARYATALTGSLMLNAAGSTASALDSASYYLCAGDKIYLSGLGGAINGFLTIIKTA